MLLVPPQLTNYPVSPEVVSGNQISLSCTAEGTMLSDITWSREGVTLGENSHLSINAMENSSTILTSQLVITNTEQADTGNYSCSVSSETGMDVRNFFLLVTGEEIIVYSMQLPALTTL